MRQPQFRSPGGGGAAAGRPDGSARFAACECVAAGCCKRSAAFIPSNPSAPRASQAFHPHVLSELERSSDLLRGKHLDAAFLRKKRQKSALQPVRQWYVPLDAWIAGTTAPTEADALDMQVLTAC